MLGDLIYSHGNNFIMAPTQDDKLNFLLPDTDAEDVGAQKSDNSGLPILQSILTIT